MLWVKILLLLQVAGYLNDLMCCSRITENDVSSVTVFKHSTCSRGCWSGVPNPKSKLILNSNPRSQFASFWQSQSHFWKSQLIPDRSYIPVYLNQRAKSQFPVIFKGHSKFPPNRHQLPTVDFWSLPPLPSIVGKRVHVRALQSSCV